MGIYVGPQPLPNGTFPGMFGPPVMPRRFALPGGRSSPPAMLGQFPPPPAMSMPMPANAAGLARPTGLGEVSPNIHGPLPPPGPFQPSPFMNMAPPVTGPSAQSSQGPFQRMQSAFQDNPATIWKLASGMLAHRRNANVDPFGGVAEGMYADQGLKKERREEEKEAKAATATEKFLIERLGLSPEEAAEAKSSPEVLAYYMKKAQGADMPSSYEEFQLAQQNPEFAKHLAATKGGTVVNVGPTGIDYGEPEKGLAWARNPDGTVKTDERGAPVAIPYQGGSVYNEQQAADGKAATRQGQAVIAADVVTEDIGRALKSIEEGPVLTTGLGGQLLKDVGGTPAHNLRNTLGTIKANIGFDKLQQMRENSPTGGALGPVSDFENQLLQATYGALEQSQTDDQLKYNLQRLRDIYLDIVHGPGNRPANGGGAAADPLGIR